MGNLRTVNKKIVDVTNPSGDFTSEIIDIQDFLGAAFQVIATGTITFTVEVDGSCEKGTYYGFVPRFTYISDTSTVVPAGTTLMINPFVQYYNYIRLKFTAITGTGQIEVFFNSKQN